MSGKGDPNYNRRLEIYFKSDIGGYGLPFEPSRETPHQSLMWYFVQKGEKFCHAVRKDVSFSEAISGRLAWSPEMLDWFVEWNKSRFSKHKIIGPMLRKGLREAMNRFIKREEKRL